MWPDNAHICPTAMKATQIYPSDFRNPNTINRCVRGNSINDGRATHEGVNHTSETQSMNHGYYSASTGYFSINLQLVIIKFCKLKISTVPTKSEVAGTSLFTSAYQKQNR